MAGAPWTVNNKPADNGDSIGDNNNIDMKCMNDYTTTITLSAGRSQCEMLIIAWLQVQSPVSPAGVFLGQYFKSHCEPNATCAPDVSGDKD